MRYAIFSDIHGNLPAWEQVLNDIRELEADVLICLGDVVGYGPKPQEVLDGIRAVTDYFVLGNHDAAAAGLIDPSIFNDHAHSVVLWTRENLTGESLEFLRNVPLQLDADDILFVHAEISEPGRFSYIEEISDAEGNFAKNDHFVTFVGHTHHPVIFEKLPFGAVRVLPDNDRELDPKCRYIVNVGSAGEPRNPEDIRARYVIYDSDTRNIYFRRIDFDVEVYRSDLAATSLNHSPFFLQVLDQTAGWETAQAHDMEVPAHAIQGFNTAQRKLVLSSSMGSGTKPKPMPAPSASSHGKSAGIIFSVIAGIAALLFCGWWFFQRESQSSVAVIDEDLLTEGSIILPPDSENREIDSSSGEVASMTPRERLYSTDGPLVPDPVEEKVAQAAPEKSSPPVEVKSDPPPAPKPKAAPKAAPKVSPAPVVIPMPKPQTPKIVTIAYWPMNSDSVEGVLRDPEGGVHLNPISPASPFENIAPNPLPQTSLENPSSLARGAWVEKGPSGKFDLLPDASFTFEGWVLISPDQPPVFIGGTQNEGSETGWRLDLKSASASEGVGSIRFLYSNGAESIAAQNNEILLNQPTPHHFAVVWNHMAANPKEGRIEVYFDGVLVAETELLHSKIAATESADSPRLFRLGSPGNPERVAMDEIRFTRGILRPNEFLSSQPGPNPGGVVTGSGLKRGRLLYAVDDGQFDFADKYTKNHSAEIAPGSFRRVGYFVELGEDWVWVSMDRFQTDPKLLGVPVANSNIVEEGTVVTNLVIDSSRSDLKALNRPGLTGIIEFWASNHSENGGGKFGSDNKRWDWKDSGGTTKTGHGSFQVFAFTNDEQTKAVTLFGVTQRGGAGIGDQSSETRDGKRAPDWTFGPGTKTYKKRNLEIWVGD